MTALPPAADPDAPSKAAVEWHAIEVRGMRQRIMELCDYIADLEMELGNLQRTHEAYVRNTVEEARRPRVPR